MAVGKIYFSLTVRDSPYSKDIDKFIDALNAIDPDNATQLREASRVLPYHGTAGNTGIVFCALADALTSEQTKYLKQFALIYDNKAEFEAAQKASYTTYYAMTPDPG